jgi:hypothetical protein
MTDELITGVYFEVDKFGKNIIFVSYGESYKQEKIGSHYLDEWMVWPEELMGRTKKEAQDLLRKRDREYFQS